MSLRAILRNNEVRWYRHVEPLTPVLLFMRDHPASLALEDLRARSLPFEFDPRFDGRTARAALFVPMLAGEDVLGMVTALSATPRALSMINARTLNVLAGQAAVALENARLYAVERRRATQLAIVSDVGAKSAQVL